MSMVDNGWRIVGREQEAGHEGRGTMGSRRVRTEKGDEKGGQCEDGDYPRVIRGDGSLWESINDQRKRAHETPERHPTLEFARATESSLLHPSSPLKLECTPAFWPRLCAQERQKTSRYLSN